MDAVEASKAENKKDVKVPVENNRESFWNLHSQSTLNYILKFTIYSVELI